MYLPFGDYVKGLFSWIITVISSNIYQIFRPGIKWVLRKATGLCELQRTCYCEPAGAKRIVAIGLYIFIQFPVIVF